MDIAMPHADCMYEEPKVRKSSVGEGGGGTKDPEKNMKHR